MKKRKMRKRFLSLTMTALMAFSCVPVMAAEPQEYDPWSIGDASVTKATYTVDGKKLYARVYEDYYLNKDQTSLSDEQFENAKVAVIVPDGADENSPIFYMVDNSGWLSNAYKNLLSNGSSYSTSQDGKGNQAALALKEGYVVVMAGLRSRGQTDKDGNWNHSPVTVADAKAVIRYLRHNDGIVGDTDKIFISGTSGGGALSAAIGSNGNSSDFYEELYAIGAAGMSSKTESTIKDDVFGVVAYCPITDLGHADGSYEFAYAGARQELRKSGYTEESEGYSLSDSTMAVSPELAAWWANYVNDLNISDVSASFDTDNLTASGSLYDTMKSLIKKCYQKALDELGQKEFLDTLKTRTPAPEYKNGTPKQGWQTDWVIFNNDGTKISDIDMNGYLYYVALGQNLKNAPAFTNQGTAEQARNENNLFGLAEEEYGFLTDIVWKLQPEDSPLKSKYNSFENYWSKNKEVLTRQANMVDSIHYLTSKDGVSAPYWYVRHGSNDRDTSCANQTLLYCALENDSSIKKIDFAFAWNRGHEGSYDIAEASAFMADALADADPPLAEKDDWTIRDAEQIHTTYTIGGEKINVTQYVDYYLKDTGDLTDALFENAKVNVWVPENATDESPILYMVNNGGWMMNTYSPELISGIDPSADIDPYGDGNMAAMALKNGYVVVTAGLRSRGSADSQGNYNHSPVTVADAKAVIRYLRYNDNEIAGDTDKIFITGTSGGGALSAAIGANGNSSDFYEELYTIGAAGMTDAAASTIKDDVYGVIAYCPITDLGHADGSYDFTYGSTRLDLIAKGYTEPGNLSLNDTTMALSPILAGDWADYVNDYGLKNGVGKDLTAAFEDGQASGTLYEGMEKLMLRCLQDALDELGEETFVNTIKERTAASGYQINTAEDDSWKTDWFTIKDGVITEFDMEGYLYYVALGQVLKPAPAFTNSGTANDVGFNENNLFGNPNEKIGYLTEAVADIDNSGLIQSYGSWKNYWNQNGSLLTQQSKMVDSIAYLNDTEDGDSAAYWWVRHGSIDRDTGFANQTLLYYSLLNNRDIRTVDFAFQWNTPHSGGYDVASVEKFMADSLNGTDYKVVVDTEETTVTPAEPGKTETPVQNTDTAQPTENEENIETSEGVKTGDSANMALPIICIAAAGCAAVYTGLRIKRRML